MIQLGLRSAGWIKKQRMAITIICPNLLCRGILQVPDSVRGRRVRCGKCGKDFLVPTLSQEKSKQAGKTTEASPAVAAGESKKAD